uniref:Poly [ADP-ribose] polymerase n=1 Tax=Ascaris suum TaxID=6253 RepID=F1KUX9_ASCSU
MTTTSSSKTHSNLPYAAEYAKSGRASCKGCKDPIAMGSLRMSARQPSRFFDGLQDNWFHFDCFWNRIKKGDVNEASIRGIDLLKWDDQEKIRRKIADNEAGIGVRPEGASVAPTVKVEYARSNRGKCTQCKATIDKDCVKLGIKSSWYHVDCFKNAQPSTVAGAESISGFMDMDESDKKTLLKKFGSETEKKRKTEAKVEATEAKKAKLDDPAAVKLKKQLKTQADTLWKMREALSKCLSKNEMQQLLQSNKQILPTHGGESKLLERLVDCAIFGCPLRCTRCKNGQIVFSSSQQTYVCTGHITEFTRCSFSDQNPPRSQFVVPAAMLKSNKELAAIAIPKMRDRVYNTLASKEEVVEAKSFSYLGAHVETNEVIEHASGTKSGHSGSRGTQRQVMKGGAVVDADCEVQDVVHVWKDPSGAHWQTTLGSTDIATNKNSFYKLQLLKHDVKEKYYLFRSWGRVGTNIGGSKTEDYGGELDEAKDAFEALFLEKTGNDWTNREHFKKVAGKMSILVTDYSQKAEKDGCAQFDSKPGSKSKLPKSIQEIISMIFDVDAFNEALREFEIDLDKMPLGRLSKCQIDNAYKVLTELQDLITSGEANNDHYLDATNRFFTYIPQDFGLNSPPLLNSLDKIKDKTKLLDELLEIELAYSILKTDKDGDLTRDPIDVHYEKLHAHMEVVDKESDEFKRIMEYVKNTHAPTHNQYTIEVIDLIRVRREGESEHFKRDLPNRHLLWHGSRITNFAGILSQGLRIAPPEAPVTGYMFGKGVYFADMVSKSANYCYALNKEGFLLLCDVALGEMQEETQAKSITKLRKGKHSCKGVGRTIPDPTQAYVTDEGVTIPMGKPIDSKRTDLSLLYNEFIVYDVSQIEIKYLLRAKFNAVF